MHEIVRKVQLTELSGKRVVDRDGVEVLVPKKAEPITKPSAPPPATEKPDGIERLAAAISDLAVSSRASSIAQIAAITESQREVAAAIAGQPRQKSIKRVSIKVRREAGLIVDMVATPEY